MATLRDVYEARGRVALFHSLKGFLDGSADEGSRSERAAELGMAEGTYRVALHRLRERYRNALLEEIAGTLPAGESPDGEIRALFEALGS